MLTRFTRILPLLLLLILPMPLQAQEITSTPQVIPLTLGEARAGRLYRQGDETAYRFDMPQNQDVMVVLDADAVILPHYCIHTAEGNVRQDCPSYGGSGSDQPVLRQLYIAGDADPDTHQRVDLTLTRPLGGEANYRLDVYPLARQPLTLGTDIAWQPSAEQPDRMQYGAGVQYGADHFQVYALQADPTLPFTVEIEDVAEDGSFLWAAHEPYQVDFSSGSSERLFTSRTLDGASNDTVRGVQALSLEYLGGNDFRVVVRADDAYTLHSTQLAYQPLDAGMPVSVTLSHREPIRVLRLSNATGDAVSVSVTVADGSGALVRAYTTNDPYGQGVVLGETRNPDAVFPLDTTLEIAPSSRPIILVLQVPFVFTHDTVLMQVLWRRGAAA
jgi:hypothetical protein